ncbi:MAG: hypothetical protein WAP55_01770 [Minisyncoccia bacterium]
MNRESIQKLGGKIVSAFGAENMACILLHGSLVFNPHLSPQDADLVIVLRRKEQGDCALLRELVVQSHLSRLPIHLHLIYLEEIPANADFFSFHTCGPFFVCHLRQAEVLFGENIFDVVTGPSNYQLQLSLLQKVQQYTFQLRNFVFKTGGISEEELRQIRKKTIVVLKDLLMSEGKLIQQEVEIIHEIADRLSDFSSEELEFLQQLPEEWAIPSSDIEIRKFLQQCLAVHERAYDIMRKRMAKSEKCKFLS